MIDCYSITKSLIQTSFDIENEFILNIGCHDGLSMKDPCYDHFTKLGYAGICLDSGDFPAIHTNIPSPKVIKLMNTKATPMNFTWLLRQHDCKKHVHFLKMDIDGFDGLLVRNYLNAGFSSDIIQIEINPDIPPPFKFTVQWHPMFKHGGLGGFYGCSVSYIDNIFRSYGYVPLHINNEIPSHDIIYVSEKIASHLKIQDKGVEKLFAETKAGYSHLFSNLGIDVSGWRDNKQDDLERLNCEIWNTMCTASIAKHGMVMPFLLDY